MPSCICPVAGRIIQVVSREGFGSERGDRTLGRRVFRSRVRTGSTLGSPLLSLRRRTTEGPGTPLSRTGFFRLSNRRDGPFRRSLLSRVSAPGRVGSQGSPVPFPIQDRQWFWVNTAGVCVSCGTRHSVPLCTGRREWGPSDTKGGVVSRLDRLLPGVGRWFCPPTLSSTNDTPDHRAPRVISD